MPCQTQRSVLMSSQRVFFFCLFVFKDLWVQNALIVHSQHCVDVYLCCRCMKSFIIRNWDVVVMWKGAGWDIMSQNSQTKCVCGVHCVCTCQNKTSIVQCRECGSVQW